MELLTWSDRYSVGVEAMDLQHMRMVKMLNCLYDAMMKNQALEVTGPLLDDLLDYTRTHFSAEEAVMASGGFPGLEEHRARHRQLFGQVEEYVSRFGRGDLFLPIQLLHFLRDWIANHIEQEDRDYGPWLNERGVH